MKPGFLPALKAHFFPAQKAHFLGIDIGTSKTAVVIIDREGKTIATVSKAHGADILAGPGLSEQDPTRLLESVRSAVAALPAEAREGIAAVGVTGQMHGVLILDAKGEPVGPLVTWQDGRCGDPDFLEGLHSRTGMRLRTGFGCATLAWYAAHGKLPPAASAAATIHDWIAARLCGMVRPVTDPTDAASWGLFDLAALDWDRRAAQAAGFPVALLPLVVPCGELIGSVSAPAAGLFGIPVGVPVTAAIGDNQASLLATLTEPEKELALTLGTGGQLSAVLSVAASAAVSAAASAEALAGGRNDADTTWEYRPYPGGRLLAASASLCGGSAWLWLAETVECALKDLGLPSLPRDRLFALLNELGARAPRPRASGLTAHPHFLGERHDPARRAAIEGITMHNLTLGSLARSLAEGICVNLRDMLPPHLRDGRTRIVASGNALERNSLLRQAAADVLGLPIIMSAPAEAAAVGAAINSSRARSV